MIGVSKNFEEGRGKTIYVSGKEYAVFRYQGNLGCIDNRCLHEHAALGAGKLVGDKIECPNHKWQWHFQTGEGALGDKITSYKIWEEDGKVFIELGSSNQLQTANC